MQAKLGLFYRLFLKLLAFNFGPARKKPADNVSREDALRYIRKITGRATFPQRLSALQIRRWREVAISGLSNSIRLRLYKPRGAVRGIVVYFHGGGFVHCNLVSHHGICCRLSRQAAAMVISVSYRRAPEHKFPSAVDDGWSAFLFAQQCAHRLNLPLALAGDSAGANLAAVIARRAAITGCFPLVGQLLYYPTLTGSIAPWSREYFARGYMLTRDLLYWYAQNYLNDPQEGTHPDFAPALYEVPKNLCPSMLITAGFDPLRGEAELYHIALKRAGCESHYRCCYRAIHGFLMGYAFSRDGRRAIRQGARFLSARFLSRHDHRGRKAAPMSMQRVGSQN